MPPDGDVVALRGHHLLCVLTFAGEGYSPEFTANLHAIVQRIKRGARIELVDGPDDICAPLCADGATPHCATASTARRDDLARRAFAELLPGGVAGHTAPKLRFTPALLATARTAFADGRLRTACTGCEWYALCSDIAAGGFERALL